MADELDPPKGGILDLIHAAAKGAVGMVPIVGAPASEILAYVIGAPLAKRQEQWCERVADAIEELRSRGVEIEKLRDDPNFTDAVLQATTIAMGTHEEEKLAALRNAIVNSGIPRAVDPDMRRMMLGMVERFTVWHVRLLVLVDDPVKWFTQHQGKCPQHGIVSSFYGMISEAYSNLNGRTDFTEQVVTELQQNGLVASGNLKITMSATGAYQSWTSPLGKRLIGFIHVSG
jgi:hypothetical protein